MIICHMDRQVSVIKLRIGIPISDLVMKAHRLLFTIKSDFYSFHVFYVEKDV